MLWLVTIIVLLLLIVRRLKIQRFIESSKQLKCGIKSYPLIGHAYLFIGPVKRMQAFQEFGREAIKNGGISYLWLGSKFYAVSVDAVDLEIVLKKSLEKDNVMRFARNLLGNGFIFAPVRIWRPRRKISAPAFSPVTLNTFVKVFADQSQSMVKRAKSAVGVGAHPMWKYMSTYTFYSACETAFGVNLNSKENREDKVLNSFDIICKLVAARMVEPWLQPDALYKLLPYHKIFEKNKEILYNFIYEVIRLTRKKMKKRNETLNDDTTRIKSFLELYIEQSGGDRGYSDEELLEEALVMLIAGTDTSAVAICFTICMLANHPDVQDKVYQELQEVFGDSDRQAVVEDLPRLKYLEAVLRESLRLNPPVPVIVRKINEDTKLTSGATLRKGCAFMAHIWGTNRNPLYWEDDAEKFRPERFLEVNSRHPAAFLTFSHGPRNCLGYPYAIMSMKIALSTFLRKYRVLPKHEDMNQHEPMKLAFDIMMKDVDEFQVRLVERIKNKVL